MFDYCIFLFRFGLRYLGDLKRINQRIKQIKKLFENFI